MNKTIDFLQFYSFTYNMNYRMNIVYQMGVSGTNFLSKARNMYYHLLQIENNIIRLIKCDIEEK